MRARESAQAVPFERAVPRDAPWQRFDAWLAGATLALVGLGLVMVASASLSIAERQLGDPLYYFRRQLGYVSFGTLIAWAALRVPLELWRRLSPAALTAGMVLLALLLVPGLGREVNGSVRWLPLGPVSLQPSEPVKLLVVLYLAGYLVRRGDEVRHLWTGFLKPLGLLGLIGALLLFEPDYGATVVVFAAALGMLFLGGVPLARFAGWLGVVAAGLAGVVVAAPYRLERLTSFLNPWADPFGSGFQLTQALIAIGRGEWTGVGLGAGVQKLFYLPEAHTDFLFAVLAEELGLAGMAAVMLLFAFLVWRAFGIAHRAQLRGEPFGAHLAYGIGLLVGLQAFINMGVNMGVLPTKGLALPFMSYGGSSIVTNALAIALLLRIDHETRVER